MYPGNIRPITISRKIGSIKKSQSRAFACSVLSLLTQCRAMVLCSNTRVILVAPCRWRWMAKVRFDVTFAVSFAKMSRSLFRARPASSLGVKRNHVFRGTGSRHPSCHTFLHPSSPPQRSQTAVKVGPCDPKINKDPQESQHNNGSKKKKKKSNHSKKWLAAVIRTNALHQ